MNALETMSSSVRRTARRGAVIAAAAAGAWIALGAESVVRGGSMHYRDGLMLIPWTLTAVAFAHLHSLQRHRSGRLGAVGFAGVMAAMVLGALGNLGLVLDVSALKALGFPAGALLWLAALIPFGIATVRAGVFPRRIGIALALLEPGSLVTGIALSPIAGLHSRGAYSAGLEKGLVLAVIASVLWTYMNGQPGERGRGSRSDIPGLPATTPAQECHAPDPGERLRGTLA